MTPRRRLTLALLALAASGLLLAACSSAPDGGPDAGADAGNGTGTGSSGEPVPEGEQLTVGWIFAGSDSTNAASTTEGSFPGRIRSVVETDVTDAAAAAESVVSQGARLVLSEAPGACAAVADVHCVEVGDGEGEPTPNTVVLDDGWWNRVYLLGRAAGLLTETDNVGFVGAGDSAVQVAAVNAFALGCQSGNPNCIVRLVPAPQNPGRAVDRLARQNVDLVATTLADPALCATAADLQAVQPVLGAGDPCGNAFVAVDLAEVAEPFVQAELDGSWQGGQRGTLPLGTWGAAVGDDVKTKVEARAQEIDDGRNVFTGPLFDNQGNQQVAEGEELTPEFVATQWDWYLGGVLPLG